MFVSGQGGEADIKNLWLFGSQMQHLSLWIQEGKPDLSSEMYAMPDFSVRGCMEACYPGVPLWIVAADCLSAFSGM